VKYLRLKARGMQRRCLQIVVAVVADVALVAVVSLVAFVSVIVISRFYIA